MQRSICRSIGRTRARSANLSGGSIIFFRCAQTDGRPPSIPTLVELDHLHRRRERLLQLKNGRVKLSRPLASNKEAKPKKYILPMFPYPSGDLHLGHLRVYTISDVLARFHRMQGFDVMHPIGWDAFGLPAENAAIQRGIDPAEWTKSNIARMRGQMLLMNGRWDWDKEFATCDPKFYKHTQQLFLLLHQAGLAYQAESLVNYDPVDKTVLANEQVDANGCSWRSGAKVEKKMLKQWFFKITHFRKELLEGLKDLEKDGAWPERVLAMQKNWLGRSMGAKIKFRSVGQGQQAHPDIKVFSTRPDTLFGVQYLALASTHPVVQDVAKSDPKLRAFLDTLPTLPPDSKVGYLLSQVQALNPLSQDESTPDATKAPLPIYVAPYVLGDYGDGAVMGVPGHDARDHAFWKHNRGNEPVRVVIAQSSNTTANTKVPFVQLGYLNEQSGPYNGLSSNDANKKILKFLKEEGLGSVAETWRLRDWLVSRQRYWGTPIPIVHCDACGPVAVPDNELPVELPPVQEHWDAGKTGNALEHAHEWVNTNCPKCSGPAKRDTDTMDTFVDSSWYFMRFPDAHNKDSMFSPEAAGSNLPVDIYVGGVEHAILHLLYARFISKFLSTTPHWPQGHNYSGEPFKQVLAQGMVHGKTYKDPDTGRYLKPDETYTVGKDSQRKVKATNRTAAVSFEKMSKSKYNGVDPKDCIFKYGADATRAHILFQAPVSEVLEWDEEKISGVTRWLNRLLELTDLGSERGTMRRGLFAERRQPFNAKQFFITRAQHTEQLRHCDINSSIDITVPPNHYGVALLKARFEAEKAIWRKVQSTIISVTDAYSRTHSLNTVVSDLMSLTKVILDRYTLEEQTDTLFRVNDQLYLHAVRTLLKLIAPITPALAEYCWEYNVNLKPVPTLVYWLWELGVRLKQLTVGTSITAKRKLIEHAMQQEVPWPTPRYEHLLTTVDYGSIFDQPFPTPDGTYKMLGGSTHTCAVQINGKMKVAVEIPQPPNMEGERLQKWLIQEILKTKEGKARFTGPVDIRKAKKVIVVQKGKLVNFIM